MSWLDRKRRHRRASEDWSDDAEYSRDSMRDEANEYEIEANHNPNRWDEMIEEAKDDERRETEDEAKPVYRLVFGLGLCILLAGGLYYIISKLITLVGG